MPKGSGIIVTSNPQGKQLEGFVSGTPKPGTMMQIQVGTALVGGRFTWEAYAPGADGEQRLVAILLPNDEEGQLATTAFVSGTRCKLYVPCAGEEMNILFGDTAGTGDDIAVGDMLIADTGTGKFIKTTGSPESEPFQALEALSDPTADQLLWVQATGQ
jgi:hypothetical protein